MSLPVGHCQWATDGNEHIMVDFLGINLCRCDHYILLAPPHALETKNMTCRKSSSSKLLYLMEMDCALEFWCFQSASLGAGFPLCQEPFGLFLVSTVHVE
jgi:hypothetical protein